MVYRFLTFLLISLASSACSSSSSDSIAEKVRKEFQSKMWQCGGDTWFGWSTAYVSEYLLEMKDPEIEVKSKKVSAADKANGIEWLGLVYVTAEIYRKKPKGVWSKWYDASKGIPIFQSGYPPSRSGYPIAVKLENGSFKWKPSPPDKPWPCENSQAVEISKPVDTPTSAPFKTDQAAKKTKLTDRQTSASSKTDQANDYMSKEAVSAQFTDKTFDGVYLPKNNRFVAYDAPDGKLEILRPNGKRDKGRTWFVNDKGQRCVTNPKWLNKADRMNGRCFWVKEGGGGEFHQFSADGKHLHTFTSFRDGNQL